MESISLAMGDYQDGYTKCQDLNGQEEIISAMIYNDLYRYKGALNFPAPEMYHRRSSSPIHLDDEVRRGLKHHGEMKWPKSPSAD
ncbi:MAG TPA: hypothetical protein VI260_05165 [Blastocatellia bacterium]|jgi:hypothetical protein